MTRDKQAKSGWVDSDDYPTYVYSGSAHSVSDETDPEPPYLYVPNAERGGFKKHHARPAKPPIGFRVK